MDRDQIAEGVRLAETIDGRWMILVGGFQWAPPDEPRDRSGAGSATFASRREARAAYLESERELAAHERALAARTRY